MKLDILLTDGNYQNTYAILRSLKKENLKVGIIYNFKPSLSFFSRYVDKRIFLKTDISKNPNEETFRIYADELIQVLKENKVNVLLPVGNISYKFASLYKNELQQYCEVPVSDHDIMKIAQDKDQTFEFAETNKIPIPLTLHIEENSNIEDVIKKTPIPCVIKKTNYDEGGVIYCNSKEELKVKLTALISIRKSHQSLPVVQEYIPGNGTGYYGLYDNGKCCGYFMHERLHEYPVTGGASTLAKSTYAQELKELGDKTLQTLKWHGVAMVEFKRDSRSGKLKLMEINPKFWGSYELSFTAGINFAYLTYLLAMRKPIPETGYKTDLYFRWTLPFDIMWYRFASQGQRREYKELKSRVKFHTNIHWDDLFTVIYLFLFTLIKLIRDKKYPHGHIQQKN